MHILCSKTRYFSPCPDVKNYKWQLNLVWHRMLYSCAHKATVGIKGLTVETLFKVIPRHRHIWPASMLHWRRQSCCESSLYPCSHRQRAVPLNRTQRECSGHVIVSHFTISTHNYTQPIKSTGDTMTRWQETAWSRCRAWNLSFISSRVKKWRRILMKFADKPPLRLIISAMVTKDYILMVDFKII